jgi:glyoxylase-like metal-dependent hydrolase (beta-lactamase superfamily II)
VPFLAGDFSVRPGEPDKKIRAIKPRRSTATRVLNAGDRVGSLEVVPAPGHSPGQIALLDTRDRTLIAGDAYSTVGGVATTAGPYWRFPLPGLVTWDRDMALESARALRALEPSRLAVGHGQTVDSPLAAMDAAIARHTG